MLRKICCKCKEEKDFCEFHKDKKTIDGYYSNCKECRKVKSKSDYYKNKERAKINTIIKTCSSCCVEKNINFFHKHVGSKDGYRSMCKECRSSNFKDEYNNGGDFTIKHKKRSEEYRLNNHEKINKYFKRRYVDKPHEYAWRGMIRSVIRRLGNKKESSTYEILGYSALELKEHIEKQFTDGMSWENWGEWHIDHKIPISFFNKNDDPKIVNSLDNLQPLWAIENIKKSNKIYD